jgi:hypothetical protein
LTFGPYDKGSALPEYELEDFCNSHFVACVENVIKSGNNIGIALRWSPGQGPGVFALPINTKHNSPQTGGLVMQWVNCRAKILSDFDSMRYQVFCFIIFCSIELQFNFSILPDLEPVSRLRLC